MLVAKPSRAAEIDQRIGLAVERPDALAAEPVIDVVDGIPIGPAVSEPMRLHHGLDVPDIVIAFHDDAVDARVVGIGAAILDVPGFVAQPLQPQHVVHRLPGDAGERHLADEVQDDDLSARFHPIQAPMGKRRPRTARAGMLFTIS